MFYQPEISDHFQLAQDEARHAIKVLRHNAGDVISVTDGKGHFATARIQKLTKTECFCDLVGKTTASQRSYSIHLAVAPTKSSDRMEWMVEKCVELGVDKISFINCQHSEKKRVNLDRLQKVAISAMKQSQQAWLPQIAGNMDFNLILGESAVQKFIAYVDSSNPDHLLKVASKGKSYLVLIGPEGDFSTDELELAIKNGFIKVSLGTNRLRTETAGFAACHVLGLANL